VLLGQTGVGKSSIVLRFVTNQFDRNSEATIGCVPAVPGAARGGCTASARGSRVIAAARVRHCPWRCWPWHVSPSFPRAFAAAPHVGVPPVCRLSRDNVPRLVCVGVAAVCQRGLLVQGDSRR
jgi:hypothetical protein